MGTKAHCDCGTLDINKGSIKPIVNSCEDIDIPKLPIRIEECAVIEGAMEIIKAIRPQWKFEHVQFKVFYIYDSTNSPNEVFMAEVESSSKQALDIAIQEDVDKFKKATVHECVDRALGNYVVLHSPSVGQPDVKEFWSKCNTTQFVCILRNQKALNKKTTDEYRTENLKRDNYHVYNEHKMFTDGITNKLVGCFYMPQEENGFNDTNSTSPTSSSNQHALQINGIDHGNGTTRDDSAKMNGNGENGNSTSIFDTTSPENVVLVRVYGNNTEMLIDRVEETRTIRLLHRHGFAPQLFAMFKNGLAYEYVPGVTLNLDTVTLPEIWKLVARQMARMHKVDFGDSVVRKPMLPGTMKRFLDLVPEQFSDPVKHERLKDTFLPVQKLRDEFQDLLMRLEKLQSPVVFAHNDLLLTNIIYTESLNRVTFIDHEYAAYNFQAFDIGNHFTEFAGIDEIDYSRYPSKEFQLDWLRVYLQEYRETDQVTQEDVERLYVQVNQFSLASHYLWTAWALIQAEHSSIDFDYIQFAKMRYGEYLAKRDQFLALEYKN